MKTEHTPGPWHVNGYAYKRSDSSPTGRQVYICNENSDACEGYTINSANCQVSEIRSHNRLSDARLIAAAPEMLEALKTLLFNVEHGNGLAAWDKSKDKARAAIAKAEAL